MVAISTLLEEMTGSDRAAVIRQVRCHARIALTGMFFGGGGTLLLVGWMPWGNLTFPVIAALLLVAWFSRRAMIRRATEARRIRPGNLGTGRCGCPTGATPLIAPPILA
ncbi:MAG: hypothetical protein KF712_08845 [Akkermansiaceae bacterium]|nr:hypothetical protein [Akkermansiaceae bacterium]